MERPYPEPSDEELRREEYLEACGSREIPSRTEEDLMTIWQEARPAESECRESYEIYKALCHDQHEIERQGYDRDCLRALFEDCPKLREVTVASQRSCMRQLDANRVFAKAMTEPTGDRYWWNENVHQVLSVATAAAQSGVELDSLTLLSLSPSIFDSGSAVRADQWSALKNLVRPLRRLRLFLQADASEEDEEEEPDELEPDYEQVYHHFNEILESHAHKILSVASNLRKPRDLHHMSSTRSDASSRLSTSASTEDLASYYSHVCLSRQDTTVTILHHNGSKKSLLEIAILDTTIQTDISDTASRATSRDLLQVIHRRYSGTSHFVFYLRVCGPRLFRG